MIKIRFEDGVYKITSDTKLPAQFLGQVNKFSSKMVEGKIVYQMENVPSVAYLLFNLNNIHSELCDVDSDTLDTMKERSSLINEPRISLDDEKHIGISIPLLPFYLELMPKVMANCRHQTYYTVPFSRAFDVIRLLTSIKTFLPPFRMTDDLKEILFAPIMVTSSMNNLYRTDVENLYSVHYAYKADESNFHNAGYNNISDLLVNRPLRYIDKTQLTDNFSWKKNDPVTIIAKIVSKTGVKNQHASFKVIAGKNKKELNIMFFRRFWMLEKYKIGDVVLIMGSFYYGNTVSGASMDSLAEASNIPIVPIYSQSTKYGLNTRLLMSSTHEILDRMNHDKRPFASYLENNEYMPIDKAFNELHFPSNTNNYKQALEALAFYELTYMQLKIIEKKATTEKAKGLAKPRIQGGAYDGAIDGFAWDLTDAQKSALNSIDSKLSSSSGEQILLSAEVGSGKTLVAQLTCLQSVDAGYQAVLAAPTEVLAQQLYETFVKLLAGIPASNRPTIAYLSGKTKAKDKKAILDSISYGEVDIVVGTHSILSDKVNYYNLGVVCVDEQQKFGSEQRESLLTARDDGKVPDLLTQTATPIPRSTAQAFYGDIEIITMEGKPKGRIPIKTEWVKEDPTEIVDDKNNPIWQDMVSEAKLGHKTFIVVPMVVENPKMSVASVQATYKQLKKNFPDLDIEYAHGKMKQDSQDKHMNHFRKKGDVLIASTVIEVGIDIPEATRMIVLSADRLGASSLHQIRGRVGRNDIPSKCYLVSDNDSKQSESRLQGLVDTTNGFEIAQIDLKTRGEGDLFGIKQAGESQLKFVSLVDHSELIKPARKLATAIYNSNDKNLALKDAYYVLSMDKEENK